MAKTIVNAIFAGLGSFFSPQDKTRHALVTTAEGKVYELFYNTGGKAKSYLACFDSITTADAFYAADDQTSHVIVATPDGNIGEIFYGRAGVFWSSPPLAVVPGVRALSAFFSADDNLRHVITADAKGDISEIFYSSQAGAHTSSPPLANFANIVAIAGFYSSDDKFRHVIVATANGNITEIFYSSQAGVHISNPPLANVSNIVDIAGFYTPDDNYRHVIVATADGKLTEIYYSSAGGLHISSPPLATFNGIVGISAFYSSDDGYRHVIVATADGNVTEVYYSPQIGSLVSHPPLGQFSIVAPTLEDISPDLTNLDPNATQQLDSNYISTAGRTLSIAGSASNLFLFQDHAGIWVNHGAGGWTQLPNGPLQSSLYPHSEIAVDPNAPGHVVAATTAGAFESTDGGNIWTLALDPSGQTGWNVSSAAIRSVVFANDSSLILATDEGIATRSGGGSYQWFSANGQVTALAVSQTKIWARTATSLFSSSDNGKTWSTLLNNDINFPVSNQNDAFSLAAFDDFAYMLYSVPKQGGCGGAGCVLAVYSAAQKQLVSWPVNSLVKGKPVQVCDGTGLGGRKFVRGFILKDANLPNAVGPGGRLQLFFGSAQEVHQAAGIDSTGNATNWLLVVATHASASLTSNGVAPPLRIHADIWDFLIDTSVNGNQAWVAGDGGVYQIAVTSAFQFPESSNWNRFFSGMHTHQAHMVSVIPTSPVNRSRVAYPTGDNEGWYQDASMLVNPAAKWEVTNRSTGNLGDVNWTVVDINSPVFIFLVRNQEAAALVSYDGTNPDLTYVTFLNYWKKKDASGNPQPLGGHFYPTGTTAFQFIPSPKSAGGFATLDAVMMCDLPLVAYDAVNDANVAMFPASNPLGASTNGQPVLLRNRNFQTNADINKTKAAGWSVELGHMPAGAAGFYVTGGRAAPVYYCYTSGGDLYKFVAGNWTLLTSRLSSSNQFGPAFVNPYDPNVLFAIGPSSILVSNNAGTTFASDAALTALVSNAGKAPMNSLVQIAFNHDNPGEIVAGAANGVFYRNAAGRWIDLTSTLPAPLTILTGVAIDSEAVYVSFDSRSVVRITSYRNA